MRLFLLLAVAIFSNCQSEDLKVVNPIIESFKVDKITFLDKTVSETSGIINFDGRVITHNDSGGNPNLYEIDVSNGKIIRTVVIANAKNVDMEDISQDENYIYLCDIGNNSNTRKDQTIYKVSKSDYLNKIEVIAEKIEISYSDQIDFTKSSRTTNFDAEAVISIGNSLFIFTKNWGDLKTSVYKVPKEKGVYRLEKIDTYNIDGLITGADYSKNKNAIMLTGYNNFIPFIVKITNFSNENPLDGKIEKKEISVSGSIQIEGIAANPDGSYYMSAEEITGFAAVLYKLTY